MNQMGFTDARFPVDERDAKLLAAEKGLGKSDQPIQIPLAADQLLGKDRLSGGFSS